MFRGFFVVFPWPSSAVFVFFSWLLCGFIRGFFVALVWPILCLFGLEKSFKFKSPLESQRRFVRVRRVRALSSFDVVYTVSNKLRSSSRIRITHGTLKRKVLALSSRELYQAADCFLMKVPEGHNLRGTTLREAFRGICLSLRVLRGLAGVHGIFRGQWPYACDPGEPLDINVFSKALNLHPFLAC